MTCIINCKKEIIIHINNHIQDILPGDIDYSLEDIHIRMSWVVHTLAIENVAVVELVDPIEELPS